MSLRRTAATARARAEMLNCMAARNSGKAPKNFHIDSPREFFRRSGNCVMVCRRTVRTRTGAGPFVHLGPGGNITTRDRQLGHALPKILCFGARFPLTDFSHLFTLRRQIRRNVIRRAENPSPREHRTVVSRNLPEFIRDIVEAPFHSPSPTLPALPARRDANS
jgi:hypothetical protein